MISFRLSITSTLLASVCALPLAADTPTAAAPTSAPAEEPVVDLDPLVVTGTRTAQRLSEVAVRTDVVTRAELELSNPRTLADAVEFITGVRVENNCQNCNFSQIRLLGLEGAYSQILIDGQPLVSSLAAVYAVEQIPASLIERIEVVKGGGSALYGPGSIGGVINMIPHTPVETAYRVRFGLEDMAGTHVSSKSPDIGFSLGLQADVVWDERQSALTAYWQGDRELPMDLSGDGYTEVGLKELSSGGLRYNRAFRDLEAWLVVDASASFENRRGGNRMDYVEHEADIAESIQAHRNSLALSWSHQLTLVTDYRLGASYVQTERESYYGAGRDPDAYGTTDNPLLVLDAQVNHRLGAHLLTWGAQHTTEELEDVQPSYSRQTDATYRNSGLFVQDEWEFARDWELLAGARLDENNQIEDTIVSPRLALRWAASPDLVWRAGVATGFRAPQVFDEDLHITQVAGGGQIIKNDPGLAEESARTYTLGGEWSKAVRGAVWMLEANLFRTEISDSFILEEDSDQSTENESVLVRRNGSGSSIEGVEFNAGVSFGRALSLQFGFVEQRSRYDEAIEPLEGTSTRRIQRTPDRYGVATLDAGLPVWDLRLFIGAKFTGSMEVPHAAPDPADIPADYPWTYITENRIEKSPSFLTLDVSLSREIELGEWGGRHRDVVVRVGVKNLTDDRQEDFDQGEFRDSGYMYGPRLPRSVYVSTEWRF